MALMTTIITVTSLERETIRISLGLDRELCHDLLKKQREQDLYDTPYYETYAHMLTIESLMTKV